MASLRDQVLSRYFDAAKTIAGQNLASHGTFPTDSKSTCQTTDSENLDSGGYAMQDLLKRQARCLLKLHQVLVSGVRQSVEVDEGLLQKRLDDIASASMSAFYSYRFDLVPYYWRQIYTDTLILMSYHSTLQAHRNQRFEEHVFDRVVDNLDRAIITAGGAGKLLGRPWIEKTLGLLEELWSDQTNENIVRPPKRAKLDPVFSTDEPFLRPQLSPDKTCPRHENWSLEKFENYMNKDEGGGLPIVFTDLTRDWPALTDHPWNSPGYLLSKTFGGRRLVPIEVGRSYVDDGWGQKLIQFREFLKTYVDPSMDDEPPPNKDLKTITKPSNIGYLAQHNLFQQIPSLRNDIQVPDFCWADVPLHPTDPSKNHAKVDVPQLNAWFGPARTITPLHNDSYHNLLCQVVGTKYVRLYPPQETRRLRPRGVEYGVEMSNTSELDIGVIEGWDEVLKGEDGEKEESVEEIRKSLEGVPYWECVLKPGDTLVIPIGWWHYVRSLSISFSVSFWWN